MMNMIGKRLFGVNSVLKKIVNNYGEITYNQELKVQTKF